MELARPELHGQRIRLLGVTASHFVERRQLGLFDEPGPMPKRSWRSSVEAGPAVRRAIGRALATTVAVEADPIAAI